MSDPDAAAGEGEEDEDDEGTMPAGAKGRAGWSKVRVARARLGAGCPVHTPVHTLGAAGSARLEQPAEDAAVPHVRFLQTLTVHV
jgi:hypothetical protein